MSVTRSPEVDVLLAPWSGPYGGLPPFDLATPAAIGAACDIAMAARREEIRAIADNPAPPTFANTIEALEDSGRMLKRARCLLDVFSSTMATGDMPAIAQRLAPLLAALDDDIAHDARLFARIDTVCRERTQSGLSRVQQRLVEEVHDGLVRRGAGLADEAKARLADVNTHIASQIARFNQNLIAEQDTQTLFLDEPDLAGLDPSTRQAMADAATAKGQPGRWAVPNLRPIVWPFLTQSTRRDLRETVWRTWSMRGDNPGDYDNKPVIAEILRLRGEKAVLLGYPSFAHLATSARMAGTPEAAMAMLEKTWASVIDVTQAQIADFQAIADAEGADIRLAPWDRLHYAEKYRQRHFGLDAEAVKPYLALESVLQAMMWAAERLHGLRFRELHDAPVCHPSIRVFELSRDGVPTGVLWFDLFQRTGKTHGSYQQEYRCAESFRTTVLPLASVNSSLTPPANGEPTLLAWEYANVLFHEFGHALHMLCNQSPYPSLGSMGVPWDFIELPALLNERWLAERELLDRFARHYRTGEPMPSALIDSIERATAFNRVFSVNLDYLAPAIIDLRMHLLADGRAIDAVALEREAAAELGMPEAWDMVMRMPHCFHAFSPMYAAGLYVYLWADVMAADVAEAFLEAPAGLYDAPTAQRWRESILGAGSSVPAREAFRDFRGRDPDPEALLRRYGLQSAAASQHQEA